MSRRSWLEAFTQGLVANPGYKVLSLAIAVAAWLYVQGQEVAEEETVRARVQWEMPEALLAVEPLPASVSLTVTGPRNAIKRAKQGDPYLLIDLTDATSGEHSLDFRSFSPRGMPASIEVADVAPSSVRFALDEVVAKKVKIEPTWIGDPAPGYQVASVDVDPQLVSIRGPRSVVDPITTVATRPADVPGASDDVLRRVDLDLPRGVALVTDAVIRVSVDIEPTVVRREFTQAPVQVWDHPGWTCDPDRVSVLLEGPAASMAGIGEDQVVVFAHVPESPERSSYEVVYGPDEGPRLRVLHGAGEGVVVERVRPSSVVVQRP